MIWILTAQAGKKKFLNHISNCQKRRSLLLRKFKLKNYLHGAGFFLKSCVPQLVTKFVAFYGIRRFITVFTRAHHFPLSWGRSVHDLPTDLKSTKYYHPIYAYVFPSHHFPAVVLPKASIHLSSPPTRHMPRFHTPFPPPPKKYTSACYELSVIFQINSHGS